MTKHSEKLDDWFAKQRHKVEFSKILFHFSFDFWRPVRSFYLNKKNLSAGISKAVEHFSDGIRLPTKSLTHISYDFSPFLSTADQYAPQEFCFLFSVTSILKELRLLYLFHICQIRRQTNFFSNQSFTCLEFTISSLNWSFFQNRSIATIPQHLSFDSQSTLIWILLELCLAATVEAWWLISKRRHTTKMFEFFCSRFFLIKRWIFPSHLLPSAVFPEAVKFFLLWLCHRLSPLPWFDKFDTIWEIYTTLL